MNSKIHYSELIISVTDTIDLISPVLANHHKIVAYIAYSLAKKLGLPSSEQIEIEIAGSLHDIGGLTFLERIAPMDFEYTDKDYHAEKGYLLLNKFSQSERISEIIRYHHVSWNFGECIGYDGQEIPFASHILNLADRVSILVNADRKNILDSIENIVQIISKRKNDIFHPDIVAAFISLAKTDSFWLGMKYLDTPHFAKTPKKESYITLEDSSFEDFIMLISRLVDYKSRFTASHSMSVAACSECIAKQVGFSPEEVTLIRYAGYLHDIGKLAIPSELLEKNGPLEKDEFAVMRTHSYHTSRILSKSKGFETIRQWGALHHERLNGEGYPYGFTRDKLSLGSRIVAVADIFTALREKRPYRDSMTPADTLELMTKMSEVGEIDKDLVHTVKTHFSEIDAARETAFQKGKCEYHEFTEHIEKAARRNPPEKRKCI